MLKFIIVYCAVYLSLALRDLDGFKTIAFDPVFRADFIFFFVVVLVACLLGLLAEALLLNKRRNRLTFFGRIVIHYAVTILILIPMIMGLSFLFTAD